MSRREILAVRKTRFRILWGNIVAVVGTSAAFAWFVIIVMTWKG